MSLSLGILLAASVAVDLSSLETAARSRLDADRLYGELLVRLTEQGYSARTAHLPTSYRIELRASSPETVVLQVSGAEQRSEQIEVGPPAVLHLAVLQRAMVMLADLPPADSPPTHLASVHVRFRPPPGSEPDSRPYERIAVMVVEDGFELVSDPGRAEWLVCASVDGGAASIWAGRGPAACEGAPDAVVRSAGDGKAFADRVAGLARAALRAPQAAEASPTAAPDPDRSSGWAVAGSAGGLIRGSEVDPIVALSTGLGPERGLGAAATVRGISASAGHIQVYELVAAAGPTWRLHTGPVAWTAAMTGGVLYHRYAYEEGSGSTGSRLDWIVLAPVDASLTIGGGWSFRAGALAGRAAKQREHVADQTLLWYRSAWQLGLDAGLCFTFP